MALGVQGTTFCTTPVGKKPSAVRQQRGFNVWPNVSLGIRNGCKRWLFLGYQQLLHQRFMTDQGSAQSCEQQDSEVRHAIIHWQGGG